MNDVILAILFYLIFSLFGIIGLVFTRRFTGKLSVSGYILAKPLGLVIFAYPVWLLASFKLIKFNNNILIAFLFIITVSVCGYLLYRERTVIENIKKNRKKIKALWDERRSFIIKVLIVEAISLLLFGIYLYIRSFNASLESTEKFMDISLLTSAGKTDYFPFFDSWWPSKPVNYYYYGFYLFALICKLSGVPYYYGYNFSLGLILVCCALISFLCVYKLTKSRFFSVFGAGLVTAAGNLHYFTCFMGNLGPDLASKCYYPKATRILDPSYTINEFPLYSFILGDLHPHVMGIPFFLLNLYLLILFYRSSKINRYLMVSLALSMATSMLINTWDFITLGLIFAFIVVYKMGKRLYVRYKADKDTSIVNHVKAVLEKKKEMVFWSAVLLASPVVLFFPFFLHFKSPVRGVGFAPEFVAAHGGNQSTYQWPSTPWFLFGIWGLYAVIIAFGLVLSVFVSKIKNRNLLFIFYLFATSIFLVAFTELFFFQDLFHIANPPYFRANTVFKFGYHAWMLFGVATGAAMHFIALCLKKIKNENFRVSALVTFVVAVIAYSIVVFIYPIESVKQAYSPAMPWNLKDKNLTLNGIKYIELKSSDDLATINWINTHQKDRIVLVEAVGGSYTYFGRIGVNTGMGNPINWESHEWTWRFHYPSNIKKWQDALGQNIDTGYGDVAAVTAEIKDLYETEDVQRANEILAKYKVKYVYVGDSERQQYANLHEDKFAQLGKVMFTSNDSRLYQINQ